MVEKEKRHPRPATLEPEEDDNPVPEPPAEGSWGDEGGAGDYRGSPTGEGERRGTREDEDHDGE
jgi:hypothetical protein